MTTFKIDMLNGKEVKTMTASDDSAIVITIKPARKKAREPTAQELIDGNI